MKYWRKGKTVASSEYNISDARIRRQSYNLPGEICYKNTKWKKMLKMFYKKTILGQEGEKNEKYCKDWDIKIPEQNWCKVWTDIIARG